MNTQPLSTHPKVWRVLLGIFVVLTAFFGVLFYFQDIAILFIIAFALVLFADRIALDFQKNATRYRLSRWQKHIYKYSVIAFWTFAIGFLLLNSVGDVVGSLGTVQVNQGALTQYVEYLSPYIPDVIEQQFLTEDTLRGIGQEVLNDVSRFLSGLSFFLATGVIVVPLVFYLYFRRRKLIIGYVDTLIPHKFKNTYRTIAHDASHQLRDFLTAKIIESLVVGVIATLGFFVAGVEGALVFGIIAGVLNIIPYVGPVLGGIPPVLISLFAGDPTAAVLALITVVIAQLVDNLYLIPFMVSHKVKVDPLVSIVLILVGAQLFGLVGMIFSIPVYLVYKVVLREAYEELVKIYPEQHTSR